MGYFRPGRLPEDADARQAKRDARAVLTAAAAQLRTPGLLPPPTVEALSALVQDERLPVRTRRRAAGLLLATRFDALGLRGGLSPKAPKG